MKKRLSTAILILVLVFVAALSVGCQEIWFGDSRSENPTYHPLTSANGSSDTTDGGSQEEKQATFLLQFRNYTDGDWVTEEWDSYPHSQINGELIYEWEVPMYGNTVYESVVKFFEGRQDKITFRASQHTYYMFHDCTLLDGRYFNLETVYIAADGVYANCANFQTVLGADGIAGTDDDLKVLTLVYKGWIY